MKKATTQKRPVSNGGQRRSSSSSQKRAVSDNTRPKRSSLKQPVTLLPDSSTEALKTLSKIGFLADEPSFLDQRVQGSKKQEKTAKLAAQYNLKQQAIKESIQKQLSTGGRIVNMEIPVKFESKTLDLKPNEEKKKLADGFVRSERNQAMRVRDTIEQEIEDLKNGKDELIVKLNNKLLKLDELNSLKKVMHEKLAEQMQFVRDLEKALGGASIGDLNSLVALEVRDAYKQEKAIHRQLENQLLVADAERSNILEQIDMLGGEKREVIVIQNGQKKSFKVTSKNIQLLALEIKQFQNQIRNQEHEITLTKDNKYKLQIEIQTLDRQINHLNSEKSMLLQKTHEIEAKNDHAVACLGSETVRANQIHRAHSKLLSIRLLENLIDAQVKTSQQRAFQQIWKVQANERTVYLIREAIRKISKSAHTRSLRTAIQIWFQNVMAPVEAIRQQDGLQFLIQNVDSGAIQQSQWTANSDRQFIQNGTYFFGLTLLSNSVQKFQSRQKTWSFQTIKNRVLLKCYLPSPASTAQSANIRHVLTKVRRCIQRYQRQIVQSRFQRWRTETKNNLDQIRLLALAKAFATKQMSCRLFTAWKVRFLQLKLKRRSLLVRVFKNLKAHLRRKKSFGANTNLVTQMQSEANLSITEACFDRFVYFYRLKQLKKSTRLNLTITPQISELKKNIQILKDRMDRQLKVRAINSLVIVPQLKRLSQAFQRWNQTVQRQARDVRVDVKFLIIKTYKRKLSVAFSRLKNSIAFLQRSSRHGNIDQIHDQNYQMEHDRLGLNREIVIRADNTRQQGLKQFRELCLKAFQRNGCYWTRRWLSGARLKTRQLGSAQLILNKMRNRILRTALAKYKRGFNLYLQDQYNFRRAHEVKRRLQFRIKKRIYQAMADFSNQHSTKVLALRYLVKTINRHLLVRGMQNWSVYTKNSREASLLMREKEEVIIMDDLQNQLSSVSDVKNESDLTNKRFRSALMTGASETLKKWVIRSHLGGQQYGFVTWRQKTTKLRHRQILVKFLSRSIDSNMCRTVWFRWKQTLALDNRKNTIQAIKSKQIQIECQSQKISFNRQSAVQDLNQISKQHTDVNTKMSILSSKAAKVVTELISKRHENIVVSRVRYMFQHWQLYSKCQYKCVIALEKGITKMCLQRAFVQIRSFYREEYKNEVLSSHIGNLFRLKLLLPARQALNRWRTHVYRQINIDMAETTQLSIQETDNQTTRINQIKQVQSSLSSQRKNETLKIQSFKLCKQFYRFCQLQKNQIFKGQDLEKTFQIRQAIHRLRQRSQLTAKFKSKFQLLEQKRNRIYLQACFVKAWKYCYSIEKRLALGARHIENSLVFSKCLLAFQLIKRHSEIRFEATTSKKEQATRQFVKKLENMRAIRLRDAIRMIKLTTHFNSTMFFRLKQCFNNRATINARSYFEKWRLNTLKQRVVDFNNNEDGPVNIDCWNQRMNCKNLANMVREDGYTSANVQGLLKDESQKFYELGEKTISRMLVCQDENLKLLPIALDRLRTYSRLRKIWREKLNFVNGLLEFDRHNVYLRFRRWKKFDMRMREKLSSKPLLELQASEDANQRKLIHIADTLDNQSSSINEFQVQKGVLFKFFIGGQKLALSNTRASYQKVQQKALLRFSDYGNRKLQDHIGSVLEKNLGLIQQLKERISQFEHENQHLATQNDEFRYDAIKAVHNSHQAEILRQDNERLQYEVSNSAQAIKNLMQDNQLLARHLEEHRVEAKIQLEHTHNLQTQKLAELEQLKMAAERLNSSSRHRRKSSQSNHHKQSVTRDQNRSLSPIMQDHSVSIGHKSPLRLRPYFPPSNI